jgi:circadian clock protein KaiB
VLYVAGDSPNSVAALRHLRAMLARFPEAPAELEVVDVLTTPSASLRDGVLVTPTMIRKTPAPERRIIGNLSDSSALLAVLGLGGAPP